MKPNKKPPIIMLIDWVDSCSDPGWQNSADCKAHLLTCQSVGFVVEETEDIICIALNRSTKKGYTPFGELMSIPKVAITRRKKIKI